MVGYSKGETQRSTFEDFLKFLIIKRSIYITKKKKTIAKHMEDICKEFPERSNYIWKGDPFIINECASRSGMANRKKSENFKPQYLTRYKKVLSALERSDKFKKSYIKGQGRPCRAYSLG